MPPMRMVQRRRLIDSASRKAEAEVKRAVYAQLQRQYKTLKRELRRANLRKRLVKNNGALFKQQEDWNKILGDFAASLIDSLKRAAAFIFGAESRFWSSRGKTVPMFDREAIIAAYQARIGRSIGNIGGDTLAEVQKAIADWYASERSLPELIDDLSVYFDESRAELIAVTETRYLTSEISYEMMNHFGITQWVWDSIGDDLVCEECASLHGQTFDVEDTDSYPPAHPACRCGTYFVEESADGGELAAFIKPLVIKNKE